MNSNNILVGILIVLALGVGFIIGRFTSAGSTFVASPANTQSGEERNTGDTSAQTGAEGGTTIDASQLTEGQKKMLAAMGIDASTFTITPAMIACAEASIGAARVEEIKNGVSPSFSEGVKLAACYRK